MGDEENILNEEDEDDENIQAGEYHGKSDFSKPRIVESAIIRVETARAQEMKEGYWNYATSPNGDVKKVYIPDARKIYIGAVISLKCILAQEILSSEKMKESIKTFEEKKKLIFKKFAVKRVVAIGNKIKEFNDFYIPELDESFPVKIIHLGNSYGSTSRVDIDYVSGIYNYNHREYWNAMVELYDFIFDELNKMVATNPVNYFKQKAGF